MLSVLYVILETGKEKSERYLGKEKMLNVSQFQTNFQLVYTLGPT